MADKEPRRRRKRKDSQKKDDMHSEDQMFMSTRSESKDSDQEVEEDVIVVSAHQPSGFAKIVFVILFSGLVLSMSFIFISLHGTDRGSVDLFDDHHSEEHETLHNLDQGENASSIPDHSEEEVHDSHGEDEKWSSSEFLSRNIMDMLPDIGEILSFNNENTKEIRENTNMELPNNEETETKSEEISDDSTEEIEMNIAHTEETVAFTDSTSESPELSLSSEIPSDEFDPLLYEETEPSVSEAIDYSTPAYESTDYYVEETTPIHDHITKETEPIPDQKTSASSSDIIHESKTEVHPEEISDLEDNLLSSTLEDYSEEQTSISSDGLVTPEYEEEDKLIYEKASITNEIDYEIREEFDILEKKLEKNFSDNDEEEDDEDYDNDENEEEFDFWQF